MDGTKRMLLCSTGTMVGRDNGYDYRRATDVLAGLCERDLISGGELMMLPFYYERRTELVECLRGSGVPFPVIHCEKGIGSDLSKAAFLYADGRCDEAEALSRQTLELFQANCRFGEDVGARGIVLHLWGGYESDGHVEYNCARLHELMSLSRQSGLELLIENVPSSTHDPLSNWHRVIESSPEVSLIFDTRFGALHEQTKQTLTDPAIAKRLRHVHISDYVGGYRCFKNLRPILHPGEGVVDFELVKGCLDGISYCGSVTLESPVMVGSELETEQLEKSLRFVRGLLC